LVRVVLSEFSIQQCKRYFDMLAELQCSASSPSGLNWSTASSTRLSIKAKLRTRVRDKGQHF